MGGGGGSAPKRRPGDEIPKINNFTQNQLKQLENYFSGSPLLTGSRSAALTGLGAIPGLQDPFQAAMGNITPILQSGGALTPEQERDVSQATRAQFAAQGNVTGNQEVGAELLNRQSAQQQRFATALAEGQGATQEQQNIVSQAIQPSLATQQTAVGTFSQIEDPVLGYLSNLFSGNQAAQLQTQLANQGKQAGLAGGGISAISSILPLLFLSDKRLKEKIRDTGEKTPEGIPIKAFNYRGDPRRFLGVLAQDVEQKKPEAVFTDRRGIKYVNMPSIEAPLFEIAGGD